MVIQLRRVHTIKPRLEDSEMALFYFVFWRKSAHQYCARFSQEKKSRHWAVSVSFSILSSNVSCFPYNNVLFIFKNEKYSVFLFWPRFCFILRTRFLYMQWYQMTRYGNYANECIGMRPKEKEGGYFISIYLILLRLLLSLYFVLRLLTLFLKSYLSALNLLE